MFKVFLITLFLTSTGVEKSEEILIGDIFPQELPLNNSLNYKLCEKLAYQREFTHRTPSGYLGVVYLCEIR